MSDLFYDTIVTLGRPAFWASSRFVEIGGRHARVAGGVLVAANHESPYDIPLLMRHVPRRVDFVGMRELFRNPLAARFYGSMNALPLDRARAGTASIRATLDRLGRGRCVAMFPEGRFRPGPESMVHTGEIRPGIGRIATVANVPILPCAICDSRAYSGWTRWLPLRHVRYGVAFGAPIPPGDPENMEAELVRRIADLHARLRGEMAPGIGASRVRSRVLPE